MLITFRQFPPDPAAFQWNRAERHRHATKPVNRRKLLGAIKRTARRHRRPDSQIPITENFSDALWTPSRRRAVGLPVCGKPATAVLIIPSGRRRWTVDRPLGRRLGGGVSL